MHLSVLLLMCFGGLAAHGRNYYNCKVYRFTVSDDVDLKYLRELEHDSDYDYFTSLNRVGKPIDLMVCPHAQIPFEDYLRQRSIQYEVVNTNVERSLREDYNKRRLLRRTDNRKITFDQYYNLDQINNYLEQLSKNFPDIVTTESIGKSYEGRDINVVRITSPSGRNRNKPTIFVDAGIHAREWIAPATALYLIQQLVENEANREFIKQVQWVIVPVVNPDGYKFSWESAENRLWRKNRSKGKICHGVDLNRNFGFHWGGGSSFRCKEIYQGSAAFSEPESQCIRDFIKQLDNVRVYYTLHGYSEMLLLPWAYANEFIENKDELNEVADLIKNAIFSVNGTSYVAGNSADLMYPASGTTADWAKSFGIDIAITQELSPKPGAGPSGFMLDPKLIYGVVTETFAGFKVLHNYVVEKYT